jgi:hypothetical protein
VVVVGTSRAVLYHVVLSWKCYGISHWSQECASYLTHWLWSYNTIQQLYLEHDGICTIPKPEGGEERNKKVEAQGHQFN